ALGGHGGLVQIDLPVHQPSGVEEVFNTVNAFLFHYQLVFVHGEHQDNAVNTDVAFLHAGEKTIAVEVVQPVDVQLAGHQLIEELARIAVAKYSQGKVKRAVKLRVQSRHHQIGDAFMLYTGQQ